MASRLNEKLGITNTNNNSTSGSTKSDTSNHSFSTTSSGSRLNAKLGITNNTQVEEEPKKQLSTQAAANIYNSAFNEENQIKPITNNIYRPKIDINLKPTYTNQRNEYVSPTLSKLRKENNNTNKDLNTFNSEELKEESKGITIPDYIQEKINNPNKNVDISSIDENDLKNFIANNNFSNHVLTAPDPNATYITGREATLGETIADNLKRGYLNNKISKAYYNQMMNDGELSNKETEKLDKYLKEMNKLDEKWSTLSPKSIEKYSGGGSLGDAFEGVIYDLLGKNAGAKMGEIGGDVLSETATQLGQQAEMQFGSAGSIGTLLGATGAGVGAGYVAGNSTGIGAILPEEVATVPGGAIYGLKKGTQLNATVGTFKVEAGGAYEEMIDAGVEQDIAKPLSIIVGAVNAGIEFAEFETILNGFKNLLSAGKKKAAIDFITTYATNIAKEVAQENLQESVTYGGEALGKTLSGQENAWNWDEYLNRLGETTKGTVLANTLMSLPGAIGAGKQIKSYNRMIENLGKSATENANYSPEIVHSVQKITNYNIGNNITEKYSNILQNQMEKEKIGSIKSNISSFSDEVDELPIDRTKNDLRTIQRDIEANSINEVEKSNLKLELVKATAKNYDENGQNAFVKSFDLEKNKDIANYTTSFDAFYRAGLIGMEYSKIFDTAEFAKSYINNETMTEAYKSGLADREVKIDDFRVNDEVKSKGGIIQDSVSKNYAKNNKALFDSINNTAKRLNTIIQVVTNDEMYKLTGKNSNGFYKDGIIYLNEKDKNPIGTTALHEFTHRLENSKGYNTYKDFVINTLKANPKKYASLFEKYSDLYSEVLKEQGITDKTEINNYLNDEILADFSGQMLQDDEFVNKLVRENRSLGELIRNTIRDIINSFTYDKKAVKELKLRGIDVEVSLKDLRTAEQKLTKALANAEKENAKGDSERYSMGGIKAKTADKMKLAEAKEMYKNKYSQQQIYDATGWYKGADRMWKFVIPFKDVRFALPFSYNEAINFAQDEKLATYKTFKLTDLLKYDDVYEAYPFLKKVNVKFFTTDDQNRMGYVKNSDTSTIYLNADSFAMNYINNDGENYKGKGWGEVLIHEIQHLIQHKEGFAPGSNYTYFMNKITDEDLNNIKGMINIVGVTEEESDYWYRKEASIQKYKATPGESEADEAANRFELTRRELNPDKFVPYTNIENANKFGKFTKEKGKYRYSLQDSEGNKLSKEQQEFFKDSKVRDEEGKLQVVYHGSKNKGFNVFNYNANNQTGTDYGKAFYFTSDYQKAQGYSYDVTKDSNFQKNENEKQKIIKEIAKNGVSDELKQKYKQFSDKSWNIMQNENYKNNDINAFGEIKEIYLNLKNPLIVDANGKYYYEVYDDYFKQAKQNNNDGIIVKNVVDNPRGKARPIDVYIAFNSNQIKNIDNTNPTESDDIRYSLEDGDVADTIAKRNKLQKERNKLKNELNYQYSEAKINNRKHLAVELKNNFENTGKANINDFSRNSEFIKQALKYNYIEDRADGTYALTEKGKSKIDNYNKYTFAYKQDLQKQLDDMQKQLDDYNKQINSEMSKINKGITYYNDFQKKSLIKSITNIFDNFKLEHDTENSAKIEEFVDMYFPTYKQVKYNDIGSLDTIKDYVISSLEYAYPDTDANIYQIADKIINSFERQTTQEERSRLGSDLADINNMTQEEVSNRIQKEIESYKSKVITEKARYDSKVAEIRNKYKAREEELRSTVKALKEDKKNFKDNIKYHSKWINAIEDAKLKQKAEDRVAKSYEKKVAYRDKIINEQREKIQKQKEETKKAILKEREERARIKKQNEVAKRWTDAETKKKINEINDKNKERIKKVIAGEKEKVAEKKMKKSNTEMRQDISKKAKELSRELLKPTEKKHIPENFRSELAKFLSYLDFSTKNQSDKTKLNLIQLHYTYLELSQKEQRSDLDEFGVGSYQLFDENIDEMMQVLGNKSIAEMNTTELSYIETILNAISTRLRNANKLFIEGKFIDVSEIRDEAVKNLKAAKDYEGNSGNELISSLQDISRIQMLRPVDFFNKIGLKRNYADLRNAYNDYLDKVTLGKTFIEDILLSNKELHKALTDKNTYKFKVHSGQEINLTKGQILSLYELNKREQARGHIYGFGIKPNDDIATYEYTDKATGETKTKHKVKRHYSPVQVDVFDVNKILGTLTEEEKTFADKISGFFNNECKQWINDMSLQMYGYEKANEANYFPIRVDSNYLDTNFDVFKIDPTINNMGMLKSTMQGAKNAIIVSDILDVYTEHMSKSAMFGSFAQSIDNMKKVMNFRTSDIGSIRNLLDTKYGSVAFNYIKNFMFDIQAGIKQDKAPGFFNKLLKNYKAARIGANARSVIQQPTAYTKALDVLDAKYLLSGVATKSDFEEMYKYSPIARYKDWGFSNMDIGRDLKSVIFNEKALNDWAFEPMQIADNITWSKIWNACKKEVLDNNPGIAENYEAYMKKVSERFDEVIDRTQVVDSVFAKNDVLRQKDTSWKIMNSFMSEPYSNVGMFTYSFEEWNKVINDKNSTEKQKKDAAKKLARTTGSLLITAVNNALILTLFDMFWRKVSLVPDDDEKEAWWKMFIGNVFDYTTSSVMFVKDIISIIEGYDVKRMEYEGIKKVITSVTRLGITISNYIKHNDTTTKKTLLKQTKDAITSTAELFGIPADDILRELNSAANATLAATKDYSMYYNYQKISYDPNYSGNKTMYIKILWEAFKRYQETGSSNDFEMILDDLQTNYSGYDSDTINKKFTEFEAKEIAKDKDLQEAYKMYYKTGEETLLNQEVNELIEKGKNEKAINKAIKELYNKESGVNVDMTIKYPTIKNLRKLIEAGEMEYANEVFTALVEKGMTAEEIYDKLDDIFNN